MSWLSKLFSPFRAVFDFIFPAFAEAGKQEATRRIEHTDRVDTVTKNVLKEAVDEAVDNAVTDVMGAVDSVSSETDEDSQ